MDHFSIAVDSLSPATQNKAIQQCLDKLYLEKKVIAVLIKLRKATGQLKFRLYDMERGYSGSSNLDISDEKSFQLIRIIENVGLDITLLGNAPGETGFGSRSTRTVAHAILDALQLTLEDLNFLRTTYEQVLKSENVASFTLKTIGFYKGIVDGPVSITNEENSLRI